MIAIIDYDAGNLKSVQKALEYIGESPVVTRDAETILAESEPLATPWKNFAHTGL